MRGYHHITTKNTSKYNKGKQVKNHKTSNVKKRSVQC